MIMEKKKKSGAAKGIVSFPSPKPLHDCEADDEAVTADVSGSGAGFDMTEPPYEPDEL